MCHSSSCRASPNVTKKRGYSTRERVLRSLGMATVWYGCVASPACTNAITGITKASKSSTSRSVTALTWSTVDALSLCRSEVRTTKAPMSLNSRRFQPGAAGSSHM